MTLRFDRMRRKRYGRRWESLRQAVDNVTGGLIEDCSTTLIALPRVGRGRRIGGRGSIRVAA